MNDHKSFLKWAGGKIKLLPKLRELGIECGKRYIEPFVGSGVVALNMPHQEIIIGDTNEGLIAVWKSIKEEESFISIAKTFFNPSYNKNPEYYKLRAMFNNHLECGNLDIMTGALFLYLNKHCFNGLCRFNRRGEFNVPYNHTATAPGFPEFELLYAKEVCKRITIYKQSFIDTFKMIKKGDMVFCDPPYIPAQLNGFTAYSKDGFGREAHEELVKCAEIAQKKGATVIISNNDTLTSRILYGNATETHFIDVQKNISCKGNSRKKQSEIIAVYRP